VEALLETNLVRKSACLGTPQKKEGDPYGVALTQPLSCKKDIIMVAVAGFVRGYKRTSLLF
jgi:hypothetical protein